jgi:hypothetical protein
MKKIILLFAFLSIIIGNSGFSQFNDKGIDEPNFVARLNIDGTDYLDLYDGWIVCTFYFTNGTTITVEPNSFSGAYDYLFEAINSGQNWNAYSIYGCVPDPNSQQGYVWNIHASGHASGWTETVTASWNYGLPE